MKRFELSINREDVAIINNFTGAFAKQSLKSMAKIKRQFKHHLCCTETMCFGHMTKTSISELKDMLPKHRI